MNRINLEAIQKFIEEANKDPQLFIKTKKVVGEWNLQEGKAQFSAELEYAKGKTILEADLAPFMGGEGLKPDPIQYCLFGIASCYAGTFATIATKEGVLINSMKVSAENQIDLSTPMGVSNNPIVKSIKITVEIKSNASEEKLKEIQKEAMEKCPGVYCVSNPIPVIAEVIVANG